MLRSLLISPDNFSSLALTHALDQNASVIVQRHVRQYPKAAQLARLLRSCSPECLFLSTSNMEEFARLYRLAGTEAASLEIVAFGEQPEAEALHQLMLLGVREYVSPPFGAQAIQDVVQRVAERNRKCPTRLASTAHLYTFLPAKAGVGASTIAMNVSTALADQLGLSTLLIDCDLGAGIQQWMLRLQNTHALPEAVARSAELDEALWTQLVEQRGKLSLLASGALNPSLQIQLPELRRLLAFARNQHQIICADLSGNLERYSLELMMESKRVFLVTTPEMSELYMTHEKLKCLQSLELGDRVQLLVNRTGAGDLISINQIEQLVGIPAAMCFRNSYTEVSRSLLNGTPLKPHSQLGTQFRQLAASLASHLAGADHRAIAAPSARPLLEEWMTAPVQAQASSL